MKMTFTRIIILVLMLMTVMTLYVTSGFLLDNNCFASSPCTCSEHNINCSSRGLVAMPIFKTFNASGKYFYIYLENNNLTLLRDNAFANISSDNTSNLNINLQNNLISDLSDLCFRGIETSVTSLNLTNNRLTRLPTAFRSLTKLRNLLLARNPLITLDPITMAELGRNLWWLEIDLSHFESWPTEFHFLRELRILKLYSIPFKSIHYDAFQGFMNVLHSLSIVNSNLEELPFAICHLSQLSNLDFEGNYNLTGGSLHTEKCHLYLSRVRTLSLSDNSLTEFPNILRNASFYYNVDLSNNNIEVIQDTAIPVCKVIELNLSYNNLSRIPYSVNKINYLRRLFLSHNYIASIEDPDLENLTSLIELHLEFNKIHFISNRAFISSKHLYRIYLSNNLLKTIPAAFLSIPNLGFLGLKSNYIDCVCSDFDFTAWNTTTRFTVEGKCEFGTETLQAFVSKQVPLCN